MANPKLKPKVGLTIATKFYPENNTRDIGGEIKILKRGRKVSSLGVVISDLQITVDSVETEERYQKCGYGRLLFDAVKFLSEFTKKPIVLYSIPDAVEFYRKIGFKHAKYMRHRLAFSKKMDEGCSSKDMVWIPQSLNSSKRKIKVDI